MRVWFHRPFQRDQESGEPPQFVSQTRKRSLWLSLDSARAARRACGRRPIGILLVTQADSTKIQNTTTRQSALEWTVAQHH